MLRRSVLAALAASPLLIGAALAAWPAGSPTPSSGPGNTPAACCDPDCCPPGCCADKAAAQPSQGDKDCCEPGCCGAGCCTPDKK
jgi:hypothetical protein